MGTKIKEKFPSVLERVDKFEKDIANFEFAEPIKEEDQCPSTIKQQKTDCGGGGVLFIDTCATPDQS